MIVYLYKNPDDLNVVNKNIQIVKTLSGEFRESQDILNPSILIENEDGVLTSGDVNYMYIPDLKRYYYITGISFDSGRLFRINAHVDVLMTYKAQIAGNRALIARQEFNYNTMLSDPRIKHNANPLVQQLKFPNAFNGAYSYVMAVLGNS